MSDIENEVDTPMEVSEEISQSILENTETRGEPEKPVETVENSEKDDVEEATEELKADEVEPEVEQEETIEDKENADSNNVADADATTKNPDEPEEEKAAEKMYRFPLGRVKNIMKMDPEVNMVNAEAVFLVTRATELFVESLALECYSFTHANKKKTVQKPDFDRAIDSADCLAFLEGAMDD